MYGFTIRAFVEVGDLRPKVVFEEVPDLDAAVVGNGGEDRGSVRRPHHVIHLLFQREYLVAHQLFSIVVLSVPYPNCPVVRTSDEDRTVLRVPEWVAPDSVDWSCVSIVGPKVLL